MNSKLFLLAAASSFSMVGVAANYTNFIIINLDDAGYGDFSYNGAYGYKTPNIDRMAAEGVRFTHFLAGQPISGASRAGLLTGCYPNRIGFAGAPGPGSDYGISPDEMTIGELLKQKGYRKCSISRNITAKGLLSRCFIARKRATASPFRASHIR